MLSRNLLFISLFAVGSTYSVVPFDNSSQQAFGRRQYDLAVEGVKIILHKECASECLSSVSDLEGSIEKLKGIDRSLGFDANSPKILNILKGMHNDYNRLLVRSTNLDSLLDQNDPMRSKIEAAAKYCNRGAYYMFCNDGKDKIEDKRLQIKFPILFPKYKPLPQDQREEHCGQLVNRYIQDMLGAFLLVLEKKQK
jgi:hypothetical protein